MSAVASRSDAAILLDLIDGEEEAMSSNRDATERAGLARWKLRGVLIFIAIIGVALSVSASLFEKWPAVELGPIIELLARELGSALIVAGVIGLTVDLFFKQEFARDAFLAAFRYVMPKELKEEVLRILSYKFLCTDSRLLVKLEPICGTELVRVHIGAEREIKNIGHHTESFDVAMAVDDWGFDGHKPTIEQCSFDIGQGIQSCPAEEHSDLH